MVRGLAAGVLAAAVLLGGALASAQSPGTIRGVVKDSDFDVPIGGVQVLAAELALRVSTTDQGNFAFNAIAPGRYTLAFSKEGYARQVKTDVVVTSGQLTDLDVSLVGEFTEMEEVSVQDIAQFGSATEAALLQLRLDSPALLDSISSELMSRAGASNAAAALRLVSGVTLRDDKSPVVRGLPDRYVSSQMNGVRLPTADADKRAVEFDQFPAATIESIVVSKTFTPDQWGDASGGAVNIKTKGVPRDEVFANFSAQSSFNSQVAGSDFLSYRGGGLDFWGIDDGGRDIQYDNLGMNWDGAVGVSGADTPLDYKWSLSTGGSREFDDGVKLGGAVNFFYERDSSFFDDGVDDSWWVTHPGAPMTPRTLQGDPQIGEFKTALFDVTQASKRVQWGTLATVGVETENHSFDATYLYSRSTSDTVTLAEDTRGKQYFFPGYDPNDQNSPGFFDFEAAPYLRLETLNYVERTTSTFQLAGTHKIPIEKLAIGDGVRLKTPEFAWSAAWSSATFDQPDKRQFSAQWTPSFTAGGMTFPAAWTPYKPAANFTLGNLQRIWQQVNEDSQQYAASLKLPFEQWSEEEGSLKIGLARDLVKRSFDQETFSNFNDTNNTYYGEWNDPWSAHFPMENHPISEALTDVDYKGDQRVSAWYAMLDLPLSKEVRAIGGVRFEYTDIGIVNLPERDATWFPPGATAPVDLNPGDADVSIAQSDVLPSFALEYKPVDEVIIRGSYNETLARQTFKELTPILQQEYLGGPIFIGNPDLGLSSLKNYDIRVDWTPYPGGLVSASWFRKDLKDPIEYVRRVASFDYTTAVNYPKGTLIGFEAEVRQDVGHFWEPLAGLSLGANATFLDSEVFLPQDEIDALNDPTILAPMKSRHMTNAPEHLYNLFLTYDAPTGTHFGVFYTVTGDTLLAGAGVAQERYVPNEYALEYGTLNFTVTQDLAQGIRLQFQAKNLTNPEIETVYRSKYIGDDVLKTSRTLGMEFSLTFTAEFTF